MDPSSIVAMLRSDPVQSSLVQQQLSSIDNDESLDNDTDNNNDDEALTRPRQDNGYPTRHGSGSPPFATAQQQTHPINSQFPTPKEIGFHLIGKNYLLTALEYYTELLEDGVNVRELQDYFANHRNFDTYSGLSNNNNGNGNSLGQNGGGVVGKEPHRIYGHVRNLSDVNTATGETETFDESKSRLSTSEQADTLREKNEYIAVLEFELRQAKDTIEKLQDRLAQVLRATDQNNDLDLHNAADQKGDERMAALSPSLVAQRKRAQTTVSNPDSNAMSMFIQSDLKILNYLVHDYLKSTGYKMTALTFIDENDDQDLEDWEDLTGVPKDIFPPPMPLISLFESWLHSGNTEKMELTSYAPQLDSIKSIPPSPSIATRDDPLLSITSSALEQNLSNSFTSKETVGLSEQHLRTLIGLSPMSGWSSSFSGHLMSLIPNVIVNKRAELMPVLIDAIHYETGVETRLALVQQLLVLIKRPNEKQRKELVSGFGDIMKLLPTQLDFLIDLIHELSLDKFSERRVLAGALCQHFITNERIIPTLARLIRDGNGHVRMEALTQFLELMTAIQPSHLVSDSVFAETKRILKTLDRKLLLDIVSAPLVSSHFNVKELILFFDAVHDESFEITNFAFEKCIPKFIQILPMCVDSQSSVLKFIEAILDKIEISLSPSGAGSNYSSSYMRILQRSVPLFLKSFVNHFGGDGAQSTLPIETPEFSWIDTCLLNRVMTIIQSVDISRLSFITDVIQIMQSFTSCLGVEMSRRLFDRHFVAFQHYLAHDQPVIAEEPTKMNNQMLTFFVNHYLFLFPEVNQDKLLSSIFVDICRGRNGWTLYPDILAFKVTVQHILLANNRNENCLNFVSSVAEHDDHIVRGNVTTLIHNIIPFLNVNQLTKKIIPLILTLSNDSERSVRLSSLVGFSALLEYAGRKKEVLEKLEIPLRSFLDDPQPAMKIETLKMFADNILLVDESFRDSFMLPALHHWCVTEMRGKKPIDVQERNQRLQMIVNGLEILSRLEAEAGLLPQPVIQNYVIQSLILMKKEIPLLIADDISLPVLNSGENDEMQANAKFEAAQTLSYKLITSFTQTQLIDGITSPSTSFRKVGSNTPVSAPATQSQSKVFPFGLRLSRDTGNQISVPKPSRKLFFQTKLFQKSSEKATATAAPQQSQNVAVEELYSEKVQNILHAVPSPVARVGSPTEQFETIQKNAETVALEPVRLRDENVPQENHLSNDRDPRASPDIIQRPSTSDSSNFHTQEQPPMVKISSNSSLSSVSTVVNLSSNQSLTSQKSDLKSPPLAPTRLTNIMDLDNEDSAASTVLLPEIKTEADPIIPSPLPPKKPKNFFDFDDLEVLRPTEGKPSPVILDNLVTVDQSEDFIIDTIYPAKKDTQQS